MPELSSWLAYALISLGMVLTPGPNMIYLISRSICQGRTAGLISLGGVALGFLVYMVCAALSRLGDESRWFDWQAHRARARESSAIRFTGGCPYQGERR
jgi:threonine/homoserine/homoserine lactone efflux protein